MILTDTLCDRLCAAAKEKAEEIGTDNSFAISDENGLPRAFHRDGEALVLSITLVPGKAYTAAVTQCRNAQQKALRSWPSRAMTRASRWLPAVIRCLSTARSLAGSVLVAAVKRNIGRLPNMS